MLIGDLYRLYVFLYFSVFSTFLRNKLTHE